MTLEWLLYVSAFAKKQLFFFLDYQQRVLNHIIVGWYIRITLQLQETTTFNNELGKLIVNGYSVNYISYFEKKKQKI